VRPVLPPEPDLQIAFYNRLQKLRELHLRDALQAVVAASDIERIDRELSLFAPAEGLRRMAGWSLRGEVVLAIPYILLQRPKLLGYYRLLLGFSQKQFYGRR